MYRTCATCTVDVVPTCTGLCVHICIKLQYRLVYHAKLKGGANPCLRNAPVSQDFGVEQKPNPILIEFYT